MIQIAIDHLPFARMISHSDTSRDGSARSSKADAASTSASTTSPNVTQHPRKNSLLRAKRPARERQRKERFELLHSMTKEERQKFIQQEATNKEDALQRLQQAATSDSSSQRIAIDLGFDDIMNDKEIRSLTNQLKLSYGSIKQMSDPFQMIFCNPSEQLEHSLARFGATNWYTQWRRGADNIAEHFPPEELVYLSPDSPNVLDKMDPKKIYVIGGIVDKSRKKGATLNAAAQAGITTVRLPIQEYITERLDHILNVNTVVDVLINFQELGDWPRALEIALPQRKRSKVGRQAIRRRKKLQLVRNSSEPGEASNAGDAASAQKQTVKQDLQEELSSIENLSLWLDDPEAADMQPEEEVSDTENLCLGDSRAAEDQKEEVSPNSRDVSVVDVDDLGA